MARILVIASHASRLSREMNVLRSIVVSGCALALILAEAPLAL